MVRRFFRTVRNDVRGCPRAMLAAASSGVLLALPTLVPACWPLVFVALVPYLLAVRPFVHDGRLRLSVLVTLALGAVWYATALYWMATLVTFHWAAVPAFLVTICLGLSEIVVIPLIVGFVFRRTGVAPALVFPFAWVTMERFRWLGDLYFPWLDLGYSLASVPLLVQIADVAGVAGVDFWIVLVNLWLAELYVHRSEAQPRAVLAMGLLVTLVVPLAYDAYAWDRHNPEAVEADRLRVAMVQPNIPQSLKWEPSARTDAIVKVQDAVKAAAAAQPDLVVMPESVLPLMLRTDGGRMSEIDIPSVGAVAGHPGVPVLAGAIGIAGAYPSYSYTNSAVLYNAAGDEIARYDKTQLVPIMEALPFQTLLGGVAGLIGTDMITRGLSASIALGLANMRPGAEPVVLRGEGLPPLGVLICYESVFGAVAREERRNGARLLVSISNDAWFGETAAGYQHAAFLVLRAVENRSWVVRAANTGISAVYDPRGTVVKRTVMSTSDTLVAEVPPAGEPPLFSSLPFDLVVSVCLIVTAALVAWASLQHPD